VSLRVGLNLLHLVPGETGGMETYARRLIPALVAAGHVDLTLFVAREAVDSLEAEPWTRRVELVRLPVRARSRTLRVLAEQALLPLAVRQSGVRLLHNLFATAPALTRVPQVTTIHDLIYKHEPAHSLLMGRGIALLVPLAARRSRRVLTVSEASKRDIVQLLGIGPERIDVTYEGPGMRDDVAPVPEPELRRRFALGDRPLVLAVSAKRPHKNLERLIDAVGRLGAAQAHVLLLPGYPTAFEAELQRRAASLDGGERVRFVGWVDDATLEGLYRMAACLVLPSLVEGFGLPVLEAMRRGVPVACSRGSSLPEVAGEAALYFDPTDTDAISASVQKLLEDTELCQRLRAAGLKRAGQFSWQATAEATIASYERTLVGR
jgi:glycosyltransferase involved in cell wall biosynthesis